MNSHVQLTTLEFQTQVLQFAQFSTCLNWLSTFPCKLYIAAGRRQSTIVVPREAVLGRDSDAAVYTVVEGRARRQSVQLGLNDGRMVEVLNGIPEGAEVILSPVGIRDGEAANR